VAVLFNDVTERKREAVNLAFLADLGEAFSGPASVDEIVQTVGRKLGAFLNITLLFIAEINEVGGKALIPHAWKAPGMPDVPHRVPLSVFGTGECRTAASVSDFIVHRDPQDSPNPVTGSFADLGIQAYVQEPLHSDSPRRYVLVVGDAHPRGWRPDEADLIREVAQRVSPRLQRARIEEALRKSEQRFQYVVRATRDIIWDIDLVGDQLWWSEALQTQLGFAPEEIGPDMAWCFMHMHPADRGRVVQGMEEAVAGKENFWSDEFRYKCADGHYAYITDRGYIIRDAGGKALRMIGAMQDITERNQAEERLREAHARNSEILESIGVLF
jgi:PAS domain S-box-containing protein